MLAVRLKKNLNIAQGLISGSRALHFCARIGTKRGSGDRINCWKNVWNTSLVGIDRNTFGLHLEKRKRWVRKAIKFSEVSEFENRCCQGLKMNFNWNGTISKIILVDSWKYCYPQKQDSLSKRSNSELHFCFQSTRNLKQKHYFWKPEIKSVFFFQIGLHLNMFVMFSPWYLALLPFWLS